MIALCLPCLCWLQLCCRGQRRPLYLLHLPYCSRCRTASLPGQSSQRSLEDFVRAPGHTISEKRRWGGKKEIHALPLKCLRFEQLPSAAWHLPAAASRVLLLPPGCNMQAAVRLDRPVIIVSPLATCSILSSKGQACYTCVSI